MYSLILIVASGTINSVGTYSTLADCNHDRAQFSSVTNVTAACIQQPDPKAQIEQAQRLLFSLMQVVRAQ
jgi:hypothetical protein